MRETRRQFREDLIALERETLGGLDLITGQLGRALEAISYQNVELAELVVAEDQRIDARYVVVHRGALSLLARQAPVAGDLRIVAALLAIIRCVERMGDQCANIAKLVPLSGYDAPKDAEVLVAIERMGQLVLAEVTRAHEALWVRQGSMARDLVRDGALVARLSREIFSRAVEIGDDIATREWAMFMILVARAIERIADNAVEIAEQTVFIVTGLFREFTAGQVSTDLVS